MPNKGRKLLESLVLGTLYIEPNPSVLGDVLIFSGSGYPPGSTVNITVRGPNGEGPQVGGQYADEDGDFSTIWVATWAGECTVTAWSGTVLARSTFTVT